MREPPDLTPILELDRAGKIDEALDGLFQLSDGLMRKGETESLAQLLRYWPVEDANTDTTVGVLISMMPTMRYHHEYANVLQRLEPLLVEKDGKEKAEHTLLHLRPGHPK